MKETEVRTLILPVAGLAKRLRPLTVRKPKALVRLNGGSLLDHALTEASESGIKEVILVASPRHKPYFLRYIRDNVKRFSGVKISLRIQKKPMGDGHAVLQAIGRSFKKPIAVRFCDDLILGKQPALAGAISIYELVGAPVVFFERVPQKDVSRYGVAAYRSGARSLKQSEGGGKLYRLTKLVEKPPTAEAPSNLTVVGGYILTRGLLQKLRKINSRLVSDHNDALRLADVLREMLRAHQSVYGWEFPQKRFDCGNLEGFYKAERFLKKHEQSRV